MRVALLCCVAATEALTANSGGADWRYFAAGGVSAAISHGYTTPLDVIKTRMQTNPELYKGDVFFALEGDHRRGRLRLFAAGSGAHLFRLWAGRRAEVRVL